MKNDRSSDRHTIDQMDLESTEFDTINNCNTDMTRGDGNSHDPRPLQEVRNPVELVGSYNFSYWAFVLRN